MKHLKNYASYLLLLLGIAGGIVAGIFFPNTALVTYPIGQIYFNILFVLITPLVFFSIVTAVFSNSRSERTTNILSKSFTVFFLFSLVSSIFALIIGVCFFDLISNSTLNFANSSTISKKISFSNKIIDMVSVENFSDLFKSNNMIPLLIFAFLFAASVKKLGKKAEKIQFFCTQMTEVFYQMVDFMMKLAPIGFACYISFSIANTGTAVLGSYLNVLILFILFCVLMYVVFYSLIVLVTTNTDNLKLYWKYIIPPSLTAIATASSTACIPINIGACDKLGIDRTISLTMMPIGAILHKDGATGATVLKILLILGMCNIDFMNIPTVFTIILTAIISGIIMGAVPGGGASSAILIVSIFNLPNEVLPIIILLSTIFDMPATLLNSVGNIPCALIVQKFFSKKI
ncbi:dicarboxylate/amino acid:cation symporter [Leuconostoc suionicum]|uniref:dicarboxylate/amino acid:cation symporter n=1 Tax=Leuconostoc suionicum TaxID=1511761 RepID=UPI00233F5C75|nr:dicarboxylate/amino acid:cation symporter [Leuconostoc suionicum]MDC2817420.1 dicarboxylate/amino acid:cation symporter [Leuconostoc suionicum]